MATRSITERIAEIEAKENELKQKKKKLKAELSKQARNARTKRLIEVGAIVEKALGIELDTPEKREKLLSILIQERPGRNNSTYSYGAFFRKQIEENIPAHQEHKEPFSLLSEK